MERLQPLQPRIEVGPGGLEARHHVEVGTEHGERVDEGEDVSGEAIEHATLNQIALDSRAVGLDERLSLDFGEGELRAGDAFLLVTDGESTTIVTAGDVVHASI